MPVAIESRRVKRENAPVGAQIEEKRDVDRKTNGAHGVVDGHGKQHAGGATDHGNEDALGQKLPDESCATGADREPDGDFLAPFSRASEEQTGQIDAGQEKNERADGREHAGESEDRVADFRQEQARPAKTNAASGVFRIIAAHLRGQRLERSLRLRETTRRV